VTSMNGVLTGTASAPSRAAATLPVSHEDLGQALRLATSALPPGISARLTRRCGASGTRGGRRGEAHAGDNRAHGRRARRCGAQGRRARRGRFGPAARGLIRCRSGGSCDAFL
jgi:hypothetical protein